MKRCILILVIAVLYGCSSETKTKTEVSTAAPAKVDESEGLGGRFYGGLLQLNEPEFIQSLFPPEITDAYSARVSLQVYEGLFRYDPSDLKLKNSLAESYTTDNTKTIYTFKLRKNVYFHDDPCFPNGKGREFVAEDAAYCLKKLTSASGNFINKTYFAGLLNGDSEGAIKAVDKYVLQVTLQAPSNEFVYLLAEPFAAIYPKEAEEKYAEGMKTKAVGTGPFKLVICEEDISIVLKRNPNYHGLDVHGNRLPFLDAIDIKFIKDKNKELEEFKQGNLDLIYRLPTEHVIEIQDEIESGKNGNYSKFIFQKTPEMLTRILGFNIQNEALSDVNFRKAIAYAINRENILDFAIQGEGYAAGFYGLIPPVFPRYDAKQIKGKLFNKDSSKFYLNKSYYKGNKKLPSLSLHFVNEGGRNLLIANELKKQLKDYMGLEIQVQALSPAAFQELLISGKAQLFLQGISPVNPAPGGFLYGYSTFCAPFPNSSNYSNKAFDMLVQQALAADDMDRETELLQKADQMLTNDVPFAVLWYDQGLRLIQPHIVNTPNNALQYRNYAEVFIEKTQRLN
ncbi:MAG: ABC transporter substrate-binding protein [Cytophagales bacterium]|nr:ABC transporter substrate-binding protein [Cytophagales bacterium]